MNSVKPERYQVVAAYSTGDLAKVYVCVCVCVSERVDVDMQVR